MADPTQQLQQMLNNAESSFGGLNSAGQQLASALLQAAKAGNTQTTAATATSQSLAQLTARSQSVSAGMIGVTGAFGGLIGQATSLAAGIYGADKAFSSVIPTLDAISSVVTKFNTSIGLLGSGATIAGFSLGRASEAAAAFANTGIEAIQGILKFQIEAAQQVADTYSASAKAGAMFGGSISRLATEAVRAGVPIQNLVKVITNNVESLAKLGMGQERAGIIVAGMTREIFNSNSALRALYGNFDELSTGVADYLASQAQLGLSAKIDYAANKAAATDYLYRQKELTAITGKNAELLKKEEEARRNQLDYNLKLGRLGDEARKNVAEGLAISGKVFGSEGAKYAEEYFATGGKVYSKSALAYQAINQEAAAVIAGMIGAVDQSREGFRTFTGSLLKDAAPALEAYARSNENLAEINRAANNPFITSMAATSAAIIENLTFLKESTALFATIEADRLKMTTQPLDAATQAYANAQAALLNNQMQIDKTVLNNMESMGRTIALMNQIQLGFISLQGAANETLNKIIESGFQGSDAIENFLSLLMNTIQNPLPDAGAPPVPAPPSNPGVAPPTTTTPTTPAPPSNPGGVPPVPVSQSNPLSDETRERTALLQSEIDRLNREVLAMRNTPPPTNGENTDLQKSILAELQDHTNILGRMRDALA